MTPSAAAPELRLVAHLPATIAGLWTAITMTHDIAGRLVNRCHPKACEAAEGVAAACAEAAESLAASAQEALHPSTELPDPRAMELDEGLALLRRLTSGCIDLAVDLLGDEDEPLTPVEVLAVTRAVTTLCTARSLAEGRVA
ncbi:MAG TPA: hypothetical protein VES03_09360 [Motilibacterales bacterium]|nr:hypothetical protein [Motilibacterales bacterium]